MVEHVSAAAAAGRPSISYWIITPEMDTDAVVHSIRHSWMQDAGADAADTCSTMRAGRRQHGASRQKNKFSHFWQKR